MEMSKHERHKTLIDAICAVTTDQQTLAIARWWEMNPNGHAAGHLDHYLSGRGGTKPVDLQAVLREDFGVRDTVTKGILASLKQGQVSGKVPVPQSAYRDKDWQYALGGINIEWSATGPSGGPPYKAATVTARFKNQYRWHPKEARITQAVHQAAERLKTQGAQDFWMEGQGLVAIH